MPAKSRGTSLGSGAWRELGAVMLVTVGLLLTLQGGAMSAPAGDETMRTNRLVILDRSGVERMILECEPIGSPLPGPRITLMDRFGRERLRIKVGDDGRSEAMFFRKPECEEKGSSVVTAGMTLAYDDEEGAHLLAQATDKSPFIYLCSSGFHGPAKVIIASRENKAKALLEVGTDGLPRMRLSGGTGETITEFPPQQTK